MTALTACGLPRPGPTKREVLRSAADMQGDAIVIPVDPRVAKVSSEIQSLGFPASFSAAGVLGSDQISPGDTLSLTIWENVDDGLLANQGTNATELTEVQVDGAGYIFVPYAGRIRAAGNTPEALRAAITAKLDPQTPDPQVAVARVAGDGATVSVLGGVGGSGVYPIERPTRKLSAMISRAGGVTVPSEIAQIKVTRGGKSGRIWLTDLYSNPQLDIALRGGDVILVEEDTRAFTAMGAMGRQSRVGFETQTLSAVEAIAQVGGLNTNFADPTGVFVLRNERPEVVRTLTGKPVQTEQRVVYVMDLTLPSGIFNARDFLIRDGDTVYVTEAPYVQWQKALGALTGTANSANSLANVASAN
jgi:polysaccharide export outer membrane protein